MDTPNQNLSNDPGTGSGNEQHSQIEPATNAHQNEALHAAGAVGGIAAGAVIVDGALHAASQAIPGDIPLVGDVMQGTANMVTSGIQTPMSVGSVAAMAGKAILETAKVAVPEFVEAAKAYAAVTGASAAGLGKSALAIAPEIAGIALPIAIVGSVILTTPDPEPLHPFNLDPGYGVTHTENSSIQPVTAPEYSIDPSGHDNQSFSVDPNMPVLPGDPSIDPHMPVGQGDPSIDPHMSIEPGDHNNQSNDPHMSIDPGDQNNQPNDPHMSIDPGDHQNQSNDPHMSIDPGDHNNQSVDPHVSIDPNDHQNQSVDPGMHND